MLTRVVHGVLLATLLGLIAHFVETPYVLRAPGRASEVHSMISIHEVKTYPSRGRFLLTTVIYDRANLLYCLYAAIDPFAELVPTGEANERADAGDQQMEASEFLAKWAALEMAGYSVSPRPSGARILSVLPESPAVGKLEAGDIITSAGGRQVRTAEELVQALQSDRSHNFPVGFVRDGEHAETEVPTYQKGGRRLIGVQIKTELDAPQLPVDIDIQPGNISGASAGLMFSLEIYNQLTEDDLTRGYRIAGTGTIGPRGQVGPVSGVDLKVVAAYRAGATHFLCPTENLAEARAVGLPLEIMEAESLPRVVKTLDALAPKS
ncbi:MAG: PDZ domain-containing protein [Candidatus Eremiobacteraeota bacterium]|nr:PDZ domain-containing protein [Candidatus Eremiobacteraeota bacterium]